MYAADELQACVAPEIIEHHLLLAKVKGEIPGPFNRNFETHIDTVSAHIPSENILHGANLEAE